MRATLGMLGAVAVIGLGLFTGNAKADEWNRGPAYDANTGVTYFVPASYHDRDGRRFEGRRGWDRGREWRRDRDWRRDREWRGDRDWRGEREWRWHHDRDYDRD